MTTLDQILQLSERIKADFKGATTSVEDFASGAVMFDVRFNDRVFVMAYSPASGFGVDELLEGEAFDTGYRFLSKDFDSTAEELYRLLRS